MEQTFNDLCNEKQQTKQALLGFVLWTFIETALGIFREHLLLISSGVIMQTILNLSCDLPKEIDAASENEESDLDFKASGSDSMNGFW